MNLSMGRVGLGTLACAAAITLPTSALATTYVEVKTQAELNLGDPDLTLQRSIVTYNDIIYVLNADSSPADFSLVKIDGATTTVLATLASTVADLGAAFAPNDPFPGYGMGVVDNGAAIQLLDGANDEIYRFDTTTGTASVFASQADIMLETGLASVTLSNWNGTTLTGAAVVLETQSDSVLIVTTAGTVDTLVTNAQLVAANAEPDSGITADASGNYYWGSNDSDTVFKYDGVNITPLITAADFGGSTNGFSGDFFYAPDGLVYLRADVNFANRGIFSFDPAAVNPASTLTTILTEAELDAGPMGSSFTTEISWYDGNIGFHKISGSGYYNVPEPALGGLLAIGGLALLTRRR